EMIVTLDGETLQMNCFGIDGKFLRKFGTRGKGPGEYSTAIGLLVNQEKSEILLNRSPSRKINFFNLSGQFLRSNDLEFSGYRMELINKDLVAVHAGKFGFNKINCELAIMDMNGKVRKTLFPFREPVQGDQCFGFAAGTKPGSVLYHRRFDYHIYEVSADRADILLTVDFGAAAVDTGNLMNTETADKLMEADGKIFGFISLANTPDHLVANIYNNAGFRGVWILDHLSKNNQYLAVDTLLSLGNYKGIPVHYPRYTDESWFISDSDGVDWYEAIGKLPESQKVILRKEVPGFIDAEKVAIDGNPVLVLYKFREF
ncbi:MAG: 6-bladed beta-propeller, partial [Bacteroidia bacterium]|nr:6-bladed beta-propeller [Bacteroidia bacterium]